jgi:hypothetical protein
MLRQQLRAIQEELGETNPEKAQTAELRERFSKADLPEEVRQEAERELGRLERMPTAAPDYQMTRTYLELICCKVIFLTSCKFCNSGRRSTAKLSGRWAKNNASPRSALEEEHGGFLRSHQGSAGS